MEELIKVLKSILPGHNENVYKSIVGMLGLEGKSVVTDATGSENEVTIAEVASSLKSLGYEVQLPGQSTQKNTIKSSPLPYEGKSVIKSRKPTPDEEDDDDEIDEEDVKKNVTKAFHISHLGNRDEAKKMIMKDVIGQSHQQVLYEQNVAFTKYIRGGDDGMNAQEKRLLKTQFFPIESTMKAVLDEGFDVATIKATQIESQGALGGIAVPPNRQNEITTRLPGLTAVRGGGANVITLVNSNSIEIPQWKGDDTKQRYIGTLRGAWGNETKNPDEKNFEMELVPVVANIYTYKVPLSQSLVEDAANVVTMLMNDMAITMAIDEDLVFLIGDGVGKPEGILPNGLNAHGLREVTTGDADELTPRGLKALKRAIASQYRKACVWVGTSDTYGVIESMREDSGAGPNTGQFLFPDLSENDMLLMRKIYESESWPEIAANAFPLLFGNMQGYDIVERLGMTIQRYQDSGTGINKVEYQLRKRVGGKLERPWMFALQKVATGDPFS